MAGNQFIGQNLGKAGKEVGMKRYLTLLRMPGTLNLILASLPGRLSYGMLSMSLYWKAYDQSHSFAFAGSILMLNSIAGSMTAGFRASLIDRIGLKQPLLIFAPAYALGVIAFNYVENPKWMLSVSLLFGLTAPPINLSVRPLWREIVRKEWIRTAYAADVTVMSTTAILGPSIATILAASSHPTMALNVTGALMFIGGVWMGSLKVARDWKPVRKATEKVKLFNRKEMRVLLLEGIIIGFGNGVMIVGIPALAIHDHLKYLSGWLISMMGVANMIGSLIAGNISKHISPLQAFLKNYYLWALSTVPLFFLNFNLSLFVISFIIGVIGGAQMVFYIELSDAVRPIGVATALLGWLWTFEGSATALGQGAGGWFSQKISIHLPLLVNTISVFLGLAIIYFNRGALAAADRPASEIEAEKAIYEENMEH
jgi:MFS family permease